MTDATKAWPASVARLTASERANLYAEAELTAAMRGEFDAFHDAYSNAMREGRELDYALAYINAGAWPEPETAPETPPEPRPEADLPQFLDWEAEWDRPCTVEWLVAPLLPAGGALVDLVAQPKAGKSLLALEIAAGLATGRAVLGYTPKRPCTVLYLDYENHPNRDTIARLKAMGYKSTDLDRLKLWPFPNTRPYDTAPGAQAVLNVVEACGAEVVIIDTLGRVIAGEENDSHTWQALYALLLRPLKTAGVCVLRLDHTGKDADRGARGSSAKPADSDIVWTLTKDSADRRTLKAIASRFPLDEETIDIRIESEPCLRHVWTDYWQADADGCAQAVSIWEREGYTPACELSQKHAGDMLREAGLKCSQAKVGRWLKRWRGTADSR